MTNLKGKVISYAQVQEAHKLIAPFMSFERFIRKHYSPVYGKNSYRFAGYVLKKEI